MWDLHLAVLGDKGAFSSASVLVGSGEHQGYMSGWRAHVGLGSGVNGTTYPLQRGHGGPVTHTCCGAVCDWRECTTLSVSVGLEPGGISPRRLLRKLCLLTFCKSPVVWFICCIADIDLESIFH